MSNSISLKTASHEYPIIIGNEILQKELTIALAEFDHESGYVIIDENVSRLHGEMISAILDEFFTQTYELTVPQGEKSKSLSFWTDCVDFLLDNEIKRNSPVLVIGGGVTGDVGGFATASTLRGVPLIHIPTTLLAMVDSSIGGKTGINHHTGKNLIGSFYQPKRVIADLQFLQTLPDNEWINGLSEVLKYGAIRDESILSDTDVFLEGNFKEISIELLSSLISKCVKVKTDIVQEDEFEGDVRAYLNFGHTFAHALEKLFGYDKMSHGEAVYLGMLAACKLSNLTGSSIDDQPIRKFSTLYNYRVSKNELDIEELIENMKSDKKRIDQFIRFVLLNSWQHPTLKTVSDNSLIKQSWEEVSNQL